MWEKLEEIGELQSKMLECVSPQKIPIINILYKKSCCKNEKKHSGNAKEKTCFMKNARMSDFLA